MRYTFKADDCMVITIPLGSIRNAREGQLMPDKFTCRFKDTYKVFQQGYPKAFGAAQIITAVFILCLGGIVLKSNDGPHNTVFVLPSILYIVCGTLAIAAGHTPLMPVMKGSFVFNIMGLCFAVITVTMCLIISPPCWNNTKNEMCYGLRVVILGLYAFEFLLSAILIYWESKAVCRAHFNSLPMITLKQDM
ncbi:uncharacterized protein LOC132867497 [Neoarius graeffei]|uniref:uncharacterized protein LOC132867497 n=1 Tax=Neoarius graeffei TaxID=443677 RepID=UPI00298C6578|nr:uncharacterized protein LOC132867497 [Neoarius graeffei]XP_060756429.1 uncharacterized protein LOC132867497 [Neoarius graeffei]